VFLEMIKKLGIIILSICVLFVVPANAVQIGSEEDRFNLNSGNEIKNFEINEILLNNNETSDINGTITNKTTDLNSTFGNYTNETFVNQTTNLNSTVGNCTNGTFVNGTFVNGTFVNGTAVNGTVGNVTNGTVDEDKLKEQRKTLKENIIATSNTIGAISAVATGFLMTITTLLIGVQEPTGITKILTVGFALATVATGAVTVTCGIISIFVQWLM
jgi:hypothetical protein